MGTFRHARESLLGFTLRVIRTSRVRGSKPQVTVTYYWMPFEVTVTFN